MNHLSRSGLVTFGKDEKYGNNSLRRKFNCARALINYLVIFHLLIRPPKYDRHFSGMLWQEQTGIFLNQLLFSARTLWCFLTKYYKKLIVHVQFMSAFVEE